MPHRQPVKPKSNLRSIVPAMAMLLWLSEIVTAQPRVVFEDQLGGGVKPNWSADKLQISVTPKNDQKYLGPFGGESVLLNLADLPQHQLIRLSLDLLIIRSWDGDNALAGPDIFYILADDGRVIDATSFSWTDSQSFPGFFGVHTADPGTGATSKGMFGFVHEIGQCDGIYHLECVLPHRDAKLGFRFLATTQSAISDEAWGITNVKVSVDSPQTLSPQAWDDLAADDPAVARKAVWNLAASEGAVELLQQKLGRASLPPDIELLDPTRAAGRRVVLSARDGYALSDAEQRRTVLGAHVLQLIASPAARKALAGIQRQEPVGMQTTKITLRDIKTKLPVPHMPVWVYTYGRTRHASILTNDEGVATLDLPSEITGQVLLQNMRVTYAPVGLIIGAPNPPADVELPLEKAITVGGVVRNESGSAISGANVSLNVARKYEGAVISRLGRISTSTDSEGRWSLDLLPPEPDALLLGVVSPDSPANEQPAMFDAKAELAELVAGKAILKVPDSIVLHGHVVDADTGKPIEKFQVQFAFSRSNGQSTVFQPMAREGRDGTFELTIPPSYSGVLFQADATGYLRAGSSLIPRADFKKEVELKLYSSR